MQWREEYSVGIPEIDAQHRSLVDCITVVEQAVGSESRWSAVHSALVVLTKYVEIHFAVEESMLRIHDYPDFDRHVLEHRRFASELSTLKQASLQGDVSDVMIAFLDGWLNGHILTHDKDYAWYVPRVGVKHADSFWRAWWRRRRPRIQERHPELKERKSPGHGLFSAPAVSGAAAAHVAPVDPGPRPDSEWLAEWEYVLAQRERELHAAQRLAGMGNWTWNLVDGTVAWSENQFHIFGLDPAVFEPSPEAYFDLVHPEDRPQVREQLKILTRQGGQQHAELRIAHPNGTTRWISSAAESVADPSGKVVLIRGTTTDITARVELEQRVRAADQHLRAAVDSLDEYFLLCDPQDKIAVSNRRWRELNREVAQSTRPGTPFEDHLRAVLAAGLIPEATGREQDWLRETMLRHRESRSQFEIHISGKRLLIRKHRLDDGSIITVGMEVTDLERVERAIRQSEERITGIVETALHAIVSADENHRIVRFNLAAEQVFGYSATEIMGRPVAMLIPDPAWPAHNNEIAGETGAGPDARGITTSRTVLCRLRDGREVPLHAAIRESTIGGKHEYTIMLQPATDPVQRTTQ